MGTKKKGNGKFKGKIEKGIIISHELPRKLDAAEKQKKKDMLIAAVQRRAELKEEIRPTQQEIGELSKKVEKYRKEIKAGEDTVMVKCQELHNYAERKIQFRRLDTGKLVAELEEDMADEDRNLDLLNPDKKPSSRKAKKAGGDAELIAEAQEAEAAAAGEDVPPLTFEDDLPEAGQDARA